MCLSSFLFRCVGNSRIRSFCRSLKYSLLVVFDVGFAQASSFISNRISNFSLPNQNYIFFFYWFTFILSLPIFKFLILLKRYFSNFNYLHKTFNYSNMKISYSSIFSYFVSMINSHIKNYTVT